MIILYIILGIILLPLVAGMFGMVLGPAVLVLVKIIEALEAYDAWVLNKAARVFERLGLPFIPYKVFIGM